MLDELEYNFGCFFCFLHAKPVVFSCKIVVIRIVTDGVEIPRSRSSLEVGNCRCKAPVNLQVLQGVIK